MEEKVEVEILGHKAQISSLRSNPHLDPWWNDDPSSVWLTLNDPVGGISGFGIYLLVRTRTKDEFLEAVRQKAEQKLRELLES